MPSFFRNKRLVLLLLSFMVLVILIGFTMRDRDEVTKPEELTRDAIGWVQGVFNTPVQWVSGIVTNVQDIRDVYEENKILKARLAENKALIAENQELQNDLDELRSLLDYQESLRDYEPTKATVVSRSPENRYQQITINKGTRDGVQSNMAVITGDGLVGKVQAASSFTSTVQLVSGFDMTSLIHAAIASEEKQYGLVKGYDEQTETLLLKDIPDDAEVKKGEEVTSSGLGGVFPEGLPIGTIEKVEMDDDGLTQTAYVKPFANLYDFSTVFVIDRELFSPQLDGTEREQQEGEDEQ
ncbi:rod shape-determining protein MreC [Pontibacillus halophilus JSM 076056 = DSM 19796]|uniref:Cell shape-determining protein MreC n=1 Tax=Pontibacillus halophilus JSM 076056 = DSM 19796 TaxID=1385510 RepID=A0A0A5ICC0_9BACI|nr:rod shape-determining protein MreC [Pontibacillus halophilus]KGX93482.1 rod shape-determining protein MreC [Pontibacillus halophilus JSM 076056 = DSM 19796]